MRPSCRVTFALLALLMSAATGLGAEYYVSTTGNDGAAGTQAAPWRTIQRAVNATAAGDTVFIRDGVYAERVTVSGKAATFAQPITIASFTGEQAIVDQAGVTPPNGSSALLRIHNSNFITVRGIEFRNYKTSLDTKVPIGIYVTGACNGVRLEQNKVHDIWQSNAVIENFDANAHGIAVFGTDATPIDNLVLDGNEVYNLRLGASEAVVLNGNVTNFQVLRNVIHDCNNIGIDFIGFEGVNGNELLDQARNGLCAQNEVYNIDTQFNPAYGGNFAGTFTNEVERNGTRAAAGIYVDGGRDIIIERNHVHDCNFGTEVASEHPGRMASGITVRNNLLRANHVGGIFMGGADSSNGGIANCSFTHNTIYQNDSAGYGGGQICIQHHVTSTIIRHNIIVCNPATHQFILYDASDGGFDPDAIDWNLYSGAPVNGMEFSWEGGGASTFASWQSLSDQDGNSFFAASPGFVDAGAGDFNLQAGAAAVDSGDPAFSLAVDELDFGGLDRFVGGRVDIGMDEQGVAGPSVQFGALSFPAVSENAGPAMIRLVRSGTLGQSFSVTFTTGALGDTAVAGTDYIAHPGTTVDFDDNQTEALVAVQLIDRPGVQNVRNFTVNLSSPTNGISLGNRITATAAIKDAAGTIAINLPAASTIDVLENAGPVLIPIARTAGSDGVVGFSITTTNGTAVAGSDFTAPVTLQSLGNGVTSLNVPIPILNSTTTEPDQTFTVNLSAPTGGAALGPVTSVTVRIVDLDTTAPALPVITAPAANAVVGLETGATLNVTGTATDNKGVAGVKVKLNAAAFVDASLATPGATSTGWSLVLTPATGINVLQVQTVDTQGNVSVIVSRNFTVTRRLNVIANTVLGSVTAGFSPSSFRTVGQSVTITATPKPPAVGFNGALFAGWSLGGIDVASGSVAFTPQRLGVTAGALEKQTLTFIFREGLELTANFVANPFTPMAGSYNGLVRPSATLPDRAPEGAGPEDGTARTNATEGRFSATVQATGAFSATLTIDGLALVFAGAFDSNGDARFGTARLFSQTVARTGKPSLIVALRLENSKITGTVTARSFQQSVITGVSLVDSDRAFYHSVSPTVDPYYLGANPTLNGTFTIIFPPKQVNDQTPGYTELDYPQGHGTGRITLTKAGLVTLTGTLADGAAVSASSALSQANDFPLFVQLYNKQGFVSGRVELDKTDPDSDLAATDLQWLRPFQGTSQYYPFGWTPPIRVDMVGARYAAIAGQSILKAPGGGALQAADGDGNAILNFNSGQLSDALIKSANLSATDAVTKVPTNDGTFTLSINRTLGTFTGVFDHTDDTKPVYNGIILQKGLNAGGYGFFLTRQPVPINYLGESGEVRLLGQP